MSNSNWTLYIVPLRKSCICLQQFSCRQTTVETLHATSLQGFGYGDVVH
ncbi:MAG: hypothetical protein MGU50_08485 [Trichodesmium sp. MAG_R02]|nr:hypothetical protein [Trichodesmium sp. MAG_R02]